MAELHCVYEGAKVTLRLDERRHWITCTDSNGSEMFGQVISSDFPVPFDLDGLSIRFGSRSLVVDEDRYAVGSAAVAAQELLAAVRRCAQSVKSAPPAAGSGSSQTTYAASAPVSRSAVAGRRANIAARIVEVYGWVALVYGVIVGIRVSLNEADPLLGISIIVAVVFIALQVVMVAAYIVHRTERGN